MELDVSKLKEQIAKEKESLKSVDENIKKITGRDPNEARSIRERQGNDTRRVSVGGSTRGRDHASSFRRPWSVDSRDAANDSEPARKRAAVFSRLGASVGGRRVAVSRAKITEKEDEDYDEEDVEVKPAVQSSVVSTAKKITKDDLISAQNVGEKGKARNRRMFGMLLGTLAKFNADGQGRQSKQTLKQKEVETRLEEETEQERKKLASERKILFTERRQQQRRINLMEDKIALANELLEWEKEWEKKSHFIMTKASPSIFFLPNEFTPRTQRALQDSKDRIKGLVEKRRTSVAETMSAYDDEIKILENKQDNDNGKGVKNGEGMHVNRVNKRGGKIDNEPEEEMDLDSMEHHVDIKVDVEDAEQNAEQIEEESNEPVQSQPIDDGVQNIETEEPEQQSTAVEPVSEANGKCESSPVHESDKSNEVDNQKTENTSSSSNDAAETEQSTESTVSVAMSKQEPTGTEGCEDDTMECVAVESKPDRNEKTGVSEKTEEQSRSSASDDTSSDGDDKESDKDDKTNLVNIENPATVQSSAPSTVSGDESKVADQQGQVAKPAMGLPAADVTKKEITKTANVLPRNSKASGSRKRRDSSSSSDSTSSSSSSDNRARKARHRGGDGGSRRKDSRDNYRSRRYHRDRSKSRDRRDRSRSRDRRDRSRSRDRGGRRDRRRR